MNSRPWPIKILFFCHLIAPLANIVLGALKNKVSIYDYIVFKFYDATVIDLTVILGLIPLAGIFVFICKKWSYFAYIATIMTVILYNVFYWQRAPELYSLNSIASFVVINIFVVSYFFIPAVRIVYFNERLRWWESEPRYVVGLEGSITFADQQHACRIENISLNGARLSGEFLARISDSSIVNFVYEDESFQIECEIINQLGNQYGVKFRHDETSKQKIRRVIRQSFSKEFEKRTPPDPFWESFFKWANLLLTTGRGIVPNTPGKPSNTNGGAAQNSPSNHP